MAEEKPTEEKKEQKKQQQPAQAQPKEGEKKKGPQKKEEHRATSIVRLAGKDVNGSLPMQRALDQVKGLGAAMSAAVTLILEKNVGIPHTSNLGSLSEEQLEKIEEVIKNPAKYGVPQYMLNRRKDFETGKDMHLVSNDLAFAVRQDVNRDVANRTWRGFRHQYGQKVRGQRTRSTGRTGTTVGVVKKAEAAKAMPAKAGEAAAAAKPAAGAAAPAAAPKAAAPKEEKK